MFPDFTPLLTLGAARVIKAPFSEDGVEILTNSVEQFRSLIERNARLIDREISDQEQRDVAEGKSFAMSLCIKTANITII